MIIEVKMPKLGLTMTEGEVVKWLKKIGDEVKEGEVIANIETEKLTGEVKAPANGFLAKVITSEGSTAKVGEVIALIVTTKEELESIIKAGAEVPKKPPERVRVRATPAARRLARELGVDLTKIRGSGPSGAITKKDVMEYARSLGIGVSEEVVKPVALPTTEVLPQVAEEIELSPMRLKIAENLVRSHRESVMTTITMGVSADGLVRIRESLPEGLRPSITAFFVKAVALALKKFKEFNATLVDSKLRVFRDINIAVATAVEGGLLTPVIRNADRKSVLEISREIDDKARRAREGKLSVDELKGSTFTISNMGMYGVDVFTPILQPGQVGILGVGRIYSRFCLGKNGKVIERYFMMLSLTFDHRVVDGAKAAEFLSEVRKYIENPYVLILK